MVLKIFNEKKVCWSFFFIFGSIILIYYYLKEPNIERFEGIFVGYIEMYLNNHIQLDHFQLIPLFESNIPVDQSLPLRVQNIVESESYYPSLASLFLIIQYISGMSPQLLVILPLGLIFIPLVYISIIGAFNFSKNGRYISFLTIILFIIFLSITRYYGSFYVAPPAMMLFLTIFLCIKKYFEDSLIGKRYSIIIIICILSLCHYWHSPTMLTFYFVVSLFLVIGTFCILSKNIKKYNITFDNNFTFRRSVYLLVATVVVILTFFHLWQSQYLSLFINSPDIDLLSLFSQKLFGKNPFPVPYAFNYKDLMLGQIYYIAYLLTLILSSVMIAIPLMFFLFRAKAERRLNITTSVIFSLSIILTQIVSTITYIKSNSIGFPLIPLLLPLLSVWLFYDLDNRYQILKKFHFKFFLYSMLITLIVLNAVCAVCLPLTNEAGTNSDTKYNSASNCFNWIYSKTPLNKNIVVDFNILGLFIQHEAKISKMDLSYIDLSPKIYQILVGDHQGSSSLKGNYVVIDQATMTNGLPVHVTTTRAMLIPQWNRINVCPNQDKLYADSHLSVFLFK